MAYWRINYCRTRNWTDYKVVESELGATDAMRKTKLKPDRITEVFELTREEYETYKQKQKERKEREAEARKNAFIQ